MSSRYPGGVVRKNQLVPTTSSASGVWDLNEATQATKSDIWPYSGITNPLSQSLRFRASNTAYLSRTYGAPTNNKVWTWSAWVKRGSLSLADANHLFLASPTDVGGNPTSYTRLIFETDNTLRLQSNSSANEAFTSSAVYRDPSAWYHIVLYMDAVNTTVRCYVNGVEITYASRTNPTNSNTAINGSGNHHRMGLFRSAETRSFDGYMADVYFIDGQALTPSSFGQTSAITGVWEPKPYTGTYGNNGWHLEFKDNTIGHDTSGNNDDWTPNNFSTTLGSTYDLVEDVPTQWAPRGTTDVGGVVRGNYCTLNPLSRTSGTLSEGNLKFIGAGTSGGDRVNGTIAVNSGKWYWEVKVSGTVYTPRGESTWYSAFGYNLATTFDSHTSPRVGTDSLNYQDSGYVKNGSGSNTDTGSAVVSGDVLAIAVDLDANTFTFYKNNSSVASGTIGITAGTLLSPMVHSYSAEYGVFTANFGQQPFTYAPPAGYKAICTTNLPTPTIGATVATAANKYFDATLYTGTGANQTITNAGNFQPDFVWAKVRNVSGTHVLTDSIRGGNNQLFTNLTNAQATATNKITGFTSTGFTLGADDGTGTGDVNFNTQTYVAWQWNAGGSTVTNTSGTITSQVRANPSAGFSVVSYTGPGSGGGTIGHGLGVAPKFIIAKNRSAIESWRVYHTSLGATKYINLNATATATTDNAVWTGTEPTSTVFGVANDSAVSGSGNLIIAYCFAPIAGYSAFGSYTGNGSSDGPFVYTGFRPRFILIKRTDSSDNWMLMDTAINSINVASTHIRPDSNAAELNPGGSPAVSFDFVSNGFKNRQSNGQVNASGGTYIYMAFAENPFKNALAR